MANIGDLFAMGGKHASTDSAAGTSATDSSTSLADYLIVTVGQAILYGFNMINTASAARYLFVFDSATLPANGNLPIVNSPCIAVLPIAAGANPPTAVGVSYAAASGMGEGQYRNGIVLAVSTTWGTGSTLTFTRDTGKTSFLACQYEVVYPNY